MSGYQVKNRILPFPRLPSLLASAVTLSYVGYDYQVSQLLCLLSKKCKNYY